DLGGLQQDLGPDLDRPQRRGGVGREVRVAGAGHEDRDATLLEVAHGAAADVRLGDLVHRDRAHDPHRDPHPLDRVLQREAVPDGRPHTDVIAASPRNMLPPPTTMPICTPPAWTSATWRAMNAQNAGSTPYWRSPRRASPDSLSRTRR